MTCPYGQVSQVCIPPLTCPYGQVSACGIALRSVILPLLPPRTPRFPLKGALIASLYMSRARSGL